MKKILNVLCIVILIGFGFVACASKEPIDPYKELFKDDGSLIPINTKEIKEVK